MIRLAEAGNFFVKTIASVSNSRFTDDQAR